MSTPDRFLVTGAASGIGRRLVGDLAAKGHRVMACDVDASMLAARHEEDGWGENSPEGHILERAFDVRDPSAWERAVEACVDAWGGLDVLMNVAGVIRPGWVVDVTKDDVDLHFDINVKGVIYGTRAGARVMAVQPEGGHIVNIASMASLAPIAGIGLYSASKYAVRGFSLVAAEELRDRGVAVTTVCPDAVQTPMLDLQIDYDEAALTFTAPRFLDPGDISSLILGKVLRKKPLLVAIPKSRAFLARLADLFPGLAHLLSSMLAKKGRRVQSEIRSDIQARGSKSTKN